jgi:hypothetical protein
MEPTPVPEPAAEPAAELTEESIIPTLDAAHREAVDRESVPDDKALTVSQINGMKKEEVHAACAKYGIDIEGKDVLKLKKELKAKVV